MASSLASGNARAWLWSDSSVLQLKAEKAVSALLAVGYTLEATTPLGGREAEFLELFAWTQAADAAAFNHVWNDPRAYHWSRLAFQLVGAVLGTAELPPTAVTYLQAIGATDPAAGLADHLQQFKMFALALALATATPIRFSPFVPRLPLAIPASRWSLSGSTPMEIQGFDGHDGVLATVAGRSTVLRLDPSAPCAAGLQLHAAPEIAVGDNVLTLQAHAFNVPGLAAIPEAVAAGVPYQWQQLGVVRRALETIERHDPTSYEQFTSFMRIIAIKPEIEGGTYNTSCSRLPGAAIYTADDCPYVMAEALVHEFHHNRLFALEEQGAFLEVGQFDPVQDALFYSPWRDDPRPLYGLWHALYVFDRVLAFWLDVVRDAGVDKQVRAFGRSRIAYVSRQLLTTSAELRAFATFTAFGQELFDELAASVAAKAMAAEPLSTGEQEPALKPQGDGTFLCDCDDAGHPLTIGDVFRRHIEQFDVHGRCRSLNLAPRTAA